MENIICCVVSSAIAVCIANLCSQVKKTCKKYRYKGGKKN